MKFNVQVDDGQRSNNPQNGFIARDEPDIEKLLEHMVIVGEDRDEDIQWDRVVDAVDDINSTQKDNIRGVDQILRQDSDHRNHNQNPIRMWVNPDANEIEATAYRPGQDTLLSDVDAVEGFNQIFNNRSAPKKTLQVAAEEYFPNQNSEALQGFEDISNIRMAILEDEGAHREEAPGIRGEHLTTDTNTQYDIHGFYIEKDGKALEPQEANSLMKKIIRRDQFNVPISEPSDIPELMLEYGSVEEAVSDRDISREEFDSEYKRAQKDGVGLVTENDNLTLKGLLSAVDFSASDLRAMEEVARGADTVELESGEDLGFDLEPSRITGEAGMRMSNSYVNSRALQSASERGEVDLQENEHPESLKEFLSEYSWIGLEPDSDPTEQQAAEEQITLAKYLTEFEDVETTSLDENNFRVSRDGLRDEIFRDLLDSALGWGNSVTVADVELDYEVKMHVYDISEEEGREPISPEMSEVPTEILKEIESLTRDSLEFQSEQGFLATSNIGQIGTGEGWGSVLRLSNGASTEFETQSYGRASYHSIASLLLDSRHGEDIPLFSALDNPNDSVIETVDEMEELGWVEAELVEEDAAKISITAGELEYREAIETLGQIDAVSFNQAEKIPGRTHRVPLDEVNAALEVNPDKRDEVDGRLQEYKEEFEDLSIPTKRKLKDSTVPQLKRYANEELESKRGGQILSRVIPEPGPGDEETVVNYEHLSNQIALSSDRLCDEGLPVDFLEELEEMCEEGLIEGNLKYDLCVDPEDSPDFAAIPGEATVRDYRELKEDVKEELNKLDEQNLIRFEEPDYRLEIQKIPGAKPSERFEIGVRGEAEVTELEIEDRPVEAVAEYRVTDAEYEVNQEFRRLAEILDPLNFEKDFYENVVVETGFEY